MLYLFVVDALRIIEIRDNSAVADGMIFASPHVIGLHVSDHWRQLVIAFLRDDRIDSLLFMQFLQSAFALLPFLQLFPKF